MCVKISPHVLSRLDKNACNFLIGSIFSWAVLAKEGSVVPKTGHLFFHLIFGLLGQLLLLFLVMAHFRRVAKYIEVLLRVAHWSKFNSELFAIIAKVPDSHIDYRKSLWLDILD